jgi:2-dehydropantoate 2-reductase
LSRGGHDVVFIARGAHLAAIRTDGLRVQSPLGDMHLRDLVITDDPAELEPAELVILGVKLWDTESAAERIKPLLRPDTAVVSFQNGVVKDDILRAMLGHAHVIGGVCYIAATIAEPGLIRHSGPMQKLVFGEYGGSVSPRIENFRDACVDSGIDVEVSSQIERTIWEKFVFLVGLSGTTSLARTAIGPIRGNERARAFLRDVMDEVVQVARASGVLLPPGYADEQMTFIDTIPATMTSSMQVALERGNRLEVGWLSGDVVARGNNAGVGTPANRAIADMLAIHAGGARP